MYKGSNLLCNIFTDSRCFQNKNDIKNEKTRVFADQCKMFDFPTLRN